MQQRLYEITLLLTQRGQASASELAERFGVSKRTIYRDIDALSSAGIPVYAERGRGGGIRLLPGYVLDKVLFSEDERRQLVSQLQSLARLGTPDTETALAKLAGLFGESASWLEVDFAPWGGGDAMREQFRCLRDAILSRTLTRFNYLGADGTTQQRLVEPIRIIFRGQGWYLYGFSRERQDFRFFKLSRIQNLELLKETFKREMSPFPTEASRYNGPLLSVHLRFEKHLSFRVYDEFAHYSIQPQPDGSLLVEATFPQDSWMVGYLLSYGSGLTVLRPESLRRTLLEEAKKMVDNFQ